jgi:hypothetical protein
VGDVGGGVDMLCGDGKGELGEMHNNLVHSIVSTSVRTSTISPLIRS